MPRGQLAVASDPFMWIGALTDDYTCFQVPPTGQRQGPRAGVDKGSAISAWPALLQHDQLRPPAVVMKALLQACVS